MACATVPCPIPVRSLSTLNTSHQPCSSFLWTFSLSHQPLCPLQTSVSVVHSAQHPTPPRLLAGLKVLTGLIGNTSRTLGVMALYPLACTYHSTAEFNNVKQHRHGEGSRILAMDLSARSEERGARGEGRLATGATVDRWDDPESKERLRRLTGWMRTRADRSCCHRSDRI